MRLASWIAGMAVGVAAGFAVGAGHGRREMLETMAEPCALPVCGDGVCSRLEGPVSCPEDCDPKFVPSRDLASLP